MEVASASGGAAGSAAIRSQGPAAAPALEARELSRCFGRRVALDGVTLRIRCGESFALLGANGAGKTTFLRLVLGLLVPSGGSLSVDGLSPVLEASAVQRRVGYVMETSRLYPELRVRGLLRFLAGARGLSGGSREAAVDRTIERFGLEEVATRLVGNLSKGVQRRVSLAQAFLHDPPLVVADEPTGGLDPVQRRDVQQLLAGLRGERTLLLCTHDLDEARALTGRVAVLSQGRCVAEGATQDVLDGARALELFASRAAEIAR